MVVRGNLNFMSNLMSSMSSFQWVLQILFKKISGWSENLQKISVTLFTLSRGGFPHFLFCSIIFKHYSKITTVSPLFCLTTSKSEFHKPYGPLTSRYCSCYASRRRLAPLQLRLQKHADLRAHNFAHSVGLWRQPSPANVTYTLSWALHGINRTIAHYLV